MDKVFKKVIVEVASVTTLLGVTACATTSANNRIDNDENTWHVDNAVGNNQIDSNINAVLVTQAESDKVRRIAVVEEGMRH